VELAKLTIRCGVAAFLTDASRLGTLSSLIAAAANTCRPTLTISLVFLSRWLGRLVAVLAAYWSLLHILDEGPAEYRTVPIGLARSEPDSWPPSTGLNKSNPKRPVSCGKKCYLRPGGGGRPKLGRPNCRIHQLVGKHQVRVSRTAARNADESCPGDRRTAPRTTVTPSAGPVQMRQSPAPVETPGEAIPLHHATDKRSTVQRTKPTLCLSVSAR
jgi:hypothetical protein